MKIRFKFHKTVPKKEGMIMKQKDHEIFELENVFPETT